MWWNKKKKDLPVLVWVNFSNGLRTKMQLPNYKAVLQAMLGAAEDRHGEWLRNDDEYDPQVKFQITGLKYNEDFRVVELEFTELVPGGYNE